MLSRTRHCHSHSKFPLTARISCSIRPICVNFDPPPITSSGGWILYTPYTFDNCYVDLKRLDTFDAYLRSFSSKSRLLFNVK